MHLSTTQKKAKQIVRKINKMILVPSLFGKQNTKQLTRTYKYLHFPKKKKLHRQPIKTLNFATMYIQNILKCS